MPAAVPGQADFGSVAPDNDARVSHHQDVLAALQEREAKIKLGGGKKRIEREHSRGKMTARERVAALCDSGDFLEIGLWAADGMYEDVGGCPAAGVVVALGRVEGRLCVIVANDATVKAGAWFPMTAKKNLRAQEIAIGEPPPHPLPGRFRGRFSADAG